MQCMPMGQKNIICRKIFLPYDITPVSMNKSSFYTSLLWKKNKKNVYRILQPIKFFCPIRNSMGILEMYLEIFLAQLYFEVALTAPSHCVKFIQSEKATKFCKISTLLLSYVVPVKSKVEISQNFVAFSKYMNFKLLHSFWKNVITLTVPICKRKLQWDA